MNRLSRWSRRKLSEESDQVDAPELAESVQAWEEPTQEPGNDIPPCPAEPPEPGSLDATLPDPDNLPAGSDFKAFMQAGVSDALRRRALRRMFSGDHYGIRDGLDDYDDDYRQCLKPLASELAQRLRQWTRKLDESETEPEATNPVEQAELTEAEASPVEEYSQATAEPACDEDEADTRQMLETRVGNGTSNES